MKLFIAAFAFALLFAPAALAREQTVLARVTVYWPVADSQQQRAAYNGARLRNGHCAVDPNKIPYGSKVVFGDGEECKAIDTGPAVVSRKAARLSGRNANQRNALVVDRFFATKQEALAWADAHPHFMTLRVVAPGSDKENKGTLPGRGTMLAQANTRSTITPEIGLPAIPAPSGLQTLDVSLGAFLFFTPFLRVTGRRMVRLRPCYA